MPESPEVARVHDGLMAELRGAIIVEFNVLGGRFLKRGPSGLENINLPTQVVSAGRKGKFMWFQFTGNQFMWCTLGMSGKWAKTREPHSHFEIKLSNGTSLYFVDQRRFGTIKFSMEPEELRKKLATLGLDLLNDSIRDVEESIDQFSSLLDKRSSKTIAEALMDQRICAGVGNYIKCETLYSAKISPYRLVKNVSYSERESLFIEIRRIMRASYMQGGASIRNYQQVNGNDGQYIFYFKVYAQKLDPLGNTVIREETLDGRTTHWVPSVQI
jgi:formamidopyrimidine-DNA glycosylase